jgi:hypothetical protein
MAKVSSTSFTNTDVGSAPLGQTTEFLAEKCVKMAAGTMAATQLHHKGLEFCETAIAQLKIKRKTKGLTPRAASTYGIAASCALQIEMAETGNKAQACVLFLRTALPKPAGANGLSNGAVYVTTLRTSFGTSYRSRNSMAAYLSKFLMGVAATSPPP